MPPPRTDPIEAALHRSNSAAQGEAEKAAIAAFADHPQGIRLAPCALKLPDGSSVQVDGFRGEPGPVLAEVYAHQGPLKGGQPHKVMADAFKLVATSRLLFEGRATLLLLLTDDDAKKSLLRGWRRACLAAMGVKVTVVSLPPDVVARVVDAQRLQRMTNEGE